MGRRCLAHFVQQREPVTREYGQEVLRTLLSNPAWIERCPQRSDIAKQIDFAALDAGHKTPLKAIESMEKRLHRPLHCGAEAKHITFWG